MKYSKYFYIAITILILIVTGYRFVQYRVENNFLLYGTISCNTETESCFVWDCSLDELDCDQTPYKKVTVWAASAPDCLYENDCEDFSCEGIKECQIQNCSAEALMDEEMCF
jgi:hypothetical protein